MRRQVKPHIRDFAKRMRREQTDGEAALWEIVRGRRLEGLRFRRQHPIENFIVDFVCLDRKLVIEVDGSQHALSAADRKRDRRLAELDYRVLRFWNDDVLKNADGVASAILAYAEGCLAPGSIPPLANSKG